MKSSDELTCLNGIGKAREALLKNLSIRTIGDLLMHIPFRFLDRRTIVAITDLRPGADAVVSGRIIDVVRRRAGRGPSITAILSDDSGSITLTFFRSAFPASSLQKGMHLIACGNVELFKGYTMVHPELYFTEGADKALAAPGMLPVYRLTAGLTQGVIKKLVASALDA
ncbi:MAG: hypothetical protein GY852_05465, partial [bacterium]|nr:hypothetical protein [bacterium]